MISGIGVAAYSVYNGQSESIFGSAQVSDVKNDQKPKGDEVEKEEADIEDTVSISDEAKQLLANDKAEEAKLSAEKIAEPKENKAQEEIQLPADKRAETPKQKPKDVEKLPVEQTAKPKKNQTEEVQQLPAEKRVATFEEKENSTEKLPAEKEKAADKLEVEKNIKSKDENDNEKSDIKPKTENDLTQEELQQVQELKQRDTEVRAHEQAHISAAAGLRTSAASYDYQTGPDGKKYAVGGEVSISFTSSGNPEEDIQNAETMRNAALAPSEPSGQDRSVAKEAEKIIQQAKEKLNEQQDQQKEQITQSETAKTLIGAGGLIQS